jgi:hypothetical protein
MGRGNMEGSYHEASVQSLFIIRIRTYPYVSFNSFTYYLKGKEDVKWIN